MILTVPSWLVPGTWLENLERASRIGWVEGVELLFFSYDAEARSALAVELPGIARIAKALSLSVHLPDPLTAEAEELVSLTADFAAAYIVHPPRLAASAPKDASKTPTSSGALAYTHIASAVSHAPATAAAGLSNKSEWARLVDALRGRYGDRFLLEYTDREAFAAAERDIPGLPLCADTGRLLLDGEVPDAWIESRVDRVREVHLHGVEGRKDHAALRDGEVWLESLVALLGASSTRVELEIFSLAEVEASAAVLRKIFAREGEARARVARGNTTLGPADRNNSANAPFHPAIKFEGGME